MNTTENNPGFMSLISAQKERDDIGFITGMGLGVAAVGGGLALGSELLRRRFRKSNSFLAKVAEGVTTVTEGAGLLVGGLMGIGSGFGVYAWLESVREVNDIKVGLGLRERRLEYPYGAEFSAELLRQNRRDWE